MPLRSDPLEDLVGDLFVDRDAELDKFWQWAMRMPSPLPHDSHALIGRRRTGKTAILVNLFNRLYHEQERVLPIYVTFAEYLKRPEPQIVWSEFIDEYLTSYLRSYLAFRYREARILKDRLTLNELRPYVAQTQDELARQLIARYDEAKASPHSSLKGFAAWIVNFPSVEARTRNMPTVILIDEFQVLATAFNEERQLRWSITSLFQNAVETRWAPVLVSGSAVSTLVHEALGGALSGRFGYHYIKPLPHEHAIDLVFRLGQRYGVGVNEALAEAIWQVSAGYPYSIEALMISDSPARQRYPNLDALAEVVAYEISDNNGRLHQHNFEEFDKYSHLLNNGQLAKKVMFWVTKYPDKMIDNQQIASELGAPIEAVQEALKKLHQVDVIQPLSWSRYTGPSDPMLRRYIEYHHHLEIENLAPDEALKDWKSEYASLQGKLNRFVGEVAEVYLQGVMNRFDGRSVDGMPYFNQLGPLLLPKFTKLERRGGVVASGRMVEIDLIAEWQEAGNTLPSRWLVQAKNWQTSIGVDEVRDFLKQCTTFSQQQPSAKIVRWYFSKSGFTRPALQLLAQEGILYSDLAAFNHLAKMFDFLGLPPG